MSGSVDDYHFEWCPRDDPDFRRLNNPVCICDALGDAMKYAEAETLADLRAKVEELRDEAKADPVGSAVWRTTAYGAVLSLIEEADRG